MARPSSMQPKPNPVLSTRFLTAAFLFFSAALSVAVLSVRNVYDDELFSLDLVVSPVRTSIAIAQESDVHPPGMYVLAHLAYRLVPSFRWMNLLPILVLYTGLAVFLIQVVPLFARTRARLCLLLLATLHPQLLLWGTSFRWYSWWTGIALIALTLALQPCKPRPILSTPRSLLLGLLLACLLYLNYITFLFALALAVAMFLRYRAQPLESLLTQALLVSITFLALIAPQFHPMLVNHLADGSAQRDNPVLSTLRLLQSLVASEAYLPWHPLAILATLVFLALCLSFVIAIRRLRRQESFAPSANLLSAAATSSLTLFAIAFFLLVAASGLGSKPRNALLLIPASAPFVALFLESIRPRAQTLILCLLALWSTVGIAHILGRYGLTKSSMNDHPEQLAAFIQHSSPCSVVVTYDAGLAFVLGQSDLPNMLVISPYRGPFFGGASTLPPTGCDHPRLYGVQSYLAGSQHRVDTDNNELNIALGYIEGAPATNSFGFDADAPRKRRLAAFGHGLQSAAQLPAYRYVVTSGPIDRTRIDSMRSSMPHFLSGSDLAPSADPAQPEPTD